VQLHGRLHQSVGELAQRANIQQNKTAHKAVLFLSEHKT
jgi:hypothetical protein